ncbi:FMN-dependent alpha-hydroxy acid dehydrogenase [Cucurbitaria berberidis CBS 394.84]|uniref:FMN-dependent alpha-hydroxy acid dehydrogenase n=1 Tax=Cucurbitaria berberidis CBS 394.84 TaxID=1168544 RepID=A0A9P4GSH0_9PLEO|nr:FMN-dependent alpha-hydroxy acid dehydrogenase [Cucurbitaria berberidis CBS 394.84]KAF1851928.1 FMN-dependent alpha-hydroxy acid dehydrogenase [Cucurbitaria berberidis CBS 394.84]
MATGRSNSTETQYYEPDPDSYVQYQREIYGSLRRPKYSTKPAQWEAAARAAVPLPNFLYVNGSASSESTYAANMSAFQRYRLRPWMLVQATRRDMSVEIFGRRYPTPLLAAPIGVQGILHREAEEATARACASVKVPMILSTAATRSIEQVAEANGDGDRWYQLYWPKPQAEEFTASLLRRAKASGFQVLVVTLDTFMIGWRPSDLDESYLPFIYGTGCAVGFSDPVFQRMYEKEQAEDTRSVSEKISEIWQILKRPGSVGGAAKVLAHAGVMKKAMFFTSLIASGSYRDWNDLQTLRKYWDGPIVLKGIQTVEDAHRAIDHGIEGIVVSNHGGRQLDGAMASLDALAEIGADDRVKSSGLTILFDSGIRTGSDVLKALALGARAVLVGRPYVYGLAMGGEEGVRHVLNCMLADTDNSLANLGKKSIAEISRDDLRVIQQPAKL